MSLYSIDTKEKDCQAPGGLVERDNALENDSGFAGAIKRVERTPGVVAVNGGGRQETGGGVSPLPVLPLTNSLPVTSKTSIKVTRLVGFSKLKSLLQPVHSYFKDKVGWVTHFYLYEDGERELAYPVVKVKNRDNPYRRHQLTHKASARTYKRLRKFIESSRSFDDFMVASIGLTMPKFMSEYLASLGKPGIDMAWRLFEGFWSQDLPAVLGIDMELASHTNLHLWRTKVPIEPHYHFHSLVPNYGLVESGFKGEEGEPVFEFKRWEWHRQRGGTMVPFSDSQLEKLKELWRDRLNRFCRRHGRVFIEQKVDIFVEYVDVWPKLLHKLNYNGRHWSENYAEYSNEFPDCPEPPAWLIGYENRARCKGWWSNLRQLVVDDKVKEKLSPYTGESMRYLGKFGFEEIKTGLGYVEFVKGVPVEGYISKENLEWLEGVMRYSSKFIEES